MPTPEDISTRQIKAARALLAWSQDEMARRAGISRAEAKHLESADGPLDGGSAPARKIVDALAAAGIEFINGREPGVQLRSPADEAITPDQLNAANDE